MFSIHKISDCLKGPPTKFFGTVRHDFFEEKLAVSPSILSINFFATGFYLKHSIKGLPYEFFWQWETGKFRQKVLTLPPPTLFSNFFSIPENSERLNVSPTAFLDTVGQKMFERNLDTSPTLLSIHFFATGIFLKHSIEGLTYEFFWHWETRIFRRKILTLPPPPNLSSELFRYPKVMKD